MASLLCTFCGDAFAADKNSPKAPICGERCDHTLCRQCVWNLQDEQAKSNWRMKILHCPLCGARGFRTNGTAPECLYTAIAMLEGNGEPRAKRARTEDAPVDPPALSSVAEARMETNAVASLPTTTATSTGIVNTPSAVRRNTAAAAATTTIPTTGTDLGDFRLVENDPDTQNALLLSLADLNPGTTNDGRGVPDDERDPDAQEAILQSLAAVGNNNDDDEEGGGGGDQQSVAATETAQVAGQGNCGEGRSSPDETRASSTIEIGLPSGSQSAATGGSNLEEESSATPGTHRQSAVSVGGSSLPNIQGREEDKEAAPVTMIEVAMVHSAILQAIPFHGEGSANSPLLLDNDMELVEGNENELLEMQRLLETEILANTSIGRTRA